MCVCCCSYEDILGRKCNRPRHKVNLNWEGAANVIYCWRKRGPSGQVCVLQMLLLYHSLTVLFTVP